MPRVYIRETRNIPDPPPPWYAWVLISIFFLLAVRGCASLMEKPQPQQSPYVR